LDKEQNEKIEKVAQESDSCIFVDSFNSKKKINEKNKKQEEKISYEI